MSEPNLLSTGRVSKVRPRMRYLLRALLAGSLGLAVALLVACGGGSGLLSSNQANSLNTQLDQVSNAASSGQCGQASSAATGFSNAVDNLSGSGVNPKLVANLQQGASLVTQLAGSKCQQTTTSTATTSSATTTTSTPTSSATTTSASTTSTPTSSSSITSSTATGPTSTTQPSGGGGLPGGGSGGRGVGGG